MRFTTRHMARPVPAPQLLHVTPLCSHLPLPILRPSSFQPATIFIILARTSHTQPLQLLISSATVAFVSSCCDRPSGPLSHKSRP